MRRSRLLHRRNRRNFWNDSDDDIEELVVINNNDPSDIEVIEIRPPLESSVLIRAATNLLSTQPDDIPALLPPSFSVQQHSTMAWYIPPSLHEHSRRYSILPAFPTSFYNSQAPLLLANVPIRKLNPEELTRRQQGIYPRGYTINEENFNIPSYFRSNYQSFISSLINQYNVDESILDYNLYRFAECFRTYADDYIRRHKYNADKFELNEKQKKYAFEFYLQIDVDLFFMKTCSFRNAMPRSEDEGLFCIDEPNSRYGLSPCNNCSLCIPAYDITRRQQHTIRFGPTQTFRFINGYQTILNCPADCQTRAIIYVMVCPCGEFEYIGETSQRLGDRLWYHRQHLNRIIHEFLIGERNIQLTRIQEKDYETLVKDRMLLYKHAARCPWAIQIFLNFNPTYRCFLPITSNEAVERSRNYVLPSSLVILDSVHPTSIASKGRHAIAATADTRSDEAARSCIRNIPEVPRGYTFSTRQRIEQFQYFKYQLDMKTKPDESIDLFNVSIIAVLPVDATTAVRRFVESLFITHTEAKLNTSGRLLQKESDNIDDTGDSNMYAMAFEARISDRGEWCRNIVFRDH